MRMRVCVVDLCVGYEDLCVGYEDLGVGYEDAVFAELHRQSYRFL